MPRSSRPPAQTEEEPAIRTAYGLTFREQRQMQPEFMYQAVSHGEVDVIAGYTSDGRIAQHDLVVLDDPKHAIPPYDAVLLVSPRHAGDDRFLAALKPLIGSIDLKTMQQANLMVDRPDDKKTPEETASWLERRIGR